MRLKKLFVTIFANKPFQTIIHFLAAFLLPYLLSTSTFTGTWYERIWSILTQRQTMVFFAIYIVFIVFFNMADSRRQASTEHAAILSATKDELSRIFSCMSICLLDNESGKIELSFEDVAQMVCDSLYTILSKKFHDCEIRVNVTKQFSFNQELMYCTAGYKSYNRGKGATGAKRLAECKQYIKTIFDNNEENYDIIMSKAEIQENLYFSKTKAANKHLQQYIAIPYKGDYERICFILQLDSTVEKTFGRTRKKVEEFINAYVWPFVPLLGYAYAFDNVFHGIGGECSGKQESDKNY